MTTSSEDFTQPDLLNEPWLDPDPTPILFLDVDGVINAFGVDLADIQWSVGRADPDSGTSLGWGSGGYKYTITWDPTVVERLMSLNASGLVRVMWLTTWGHGANGELRALLGIDELPVAFHPARRDLDTYDSTWWKLRTVRWFVEHNPERKIVWCDDELARNTHATEFAKQYSILCVGPPEHTGLTHQDLDRIEAFLDE